MKDAIKLTAIIDLDPDELLDQLMPALLERLEARGLKLVPIDRPPADGAPKLHQAVPATCPLRNGGALYGWAKDHDLVKRVDTLGKAWGHPERMVDWDAVQVAGVYNEIVAKAPAGAYPIRPATRQHERRAAR
jgi:hypothetical protein